MALVFASGYF